VKRLGSFIVTAALAVGLLLVPTSASAAAGVCPKPSGVAPDTKVAILIHGWLGSEMVKGREILAPMLGDDWSTITYDYKAMNTLWPSSSLVAQCLSEFARDAQNMTGRDKPSVYFVGHSMGGIMARFALELYKEDVAKYAAGVVTLDTPHTGSPWGGSQVSMAVEAGAHWWNRNDGTKKDGAKCLSLHHPGSLPPECKYPPAMPEAVPIAQIAGNATITRTYFHFGRQRADIMTDGTVWLDSQVGYKKSLDDKQTNTVETSYTVYCDLAWGDAVTYSNVASPLATVTGKSARWLSGETLSQMQSGTTEIVKDFDSLVVLQAVSNMASCGHNVIPQDTEALTAAASYLKNWAAKTDSWLISAAGVGPATFDMNLDEIDVALGERRLRCDGSQGDWFVSVWGDNTDPSFMFVTAGGSGPFEKIPGAPQTSKGVTIGSTEEELLALGYTRGNAGPYGQAFEWEEDGVPFAADTEDGKVYSIVVGLQYFPAGYCT
jgi:pimeloyl-ACP methyl ester carboxylesterase